MASGKSVQKPAPPDKVAANKAMGELFTRIQATVSLMLTTIDARHPYALHLSQIERMAQKGIALGKVFPPPAIKAQKDATSKNCVAAISKAAPSTRSSKAVKGNGCVLLADGNEMFLDIGKEMLQATGYRVCTARTGKETVQVFQQKKGNIALIMLGMVTPEPTGTALVYKKLRQLDPHVPVLISDGYGLDEDTRRIVASNRNAFIEKPFSLQELSRKIRSLLGPQPISD